MEGDVGRRGQDLRPWLVLEIIRQTNQQSSDRPLMSRGRGRRHNQLPGDDLVAIAVVGERADQGGSPPFSGVWHTHIVLGLARVAQAVGRGATAPRLLCSRGSRHGHGPGLACNWMLPPASLPDALYPFVNVIENVSSRPGSPASVTSTV